MRIGGLEDRLVVAAGGRVRPDLSQLRRAAHERRGQLEGAVQSDAVGPRERHQRWLGRRLPGRRLDGGCSICTVQRCRALSLFLSLLIDREDEELVVSVRSPV